MPRPDFITDSDIERWTMMLDYETRMPKAAFESMGFKEMCFSGMWLGEELEKLGCPELLVVRILFTAGKLSFGRDAWEVSIMVLEKYKNNELQIEAESDIMTN
jgi:hypothetical protein